MWKLHVHLIMSTRSRAEVGAASQSSPVITYNSSRCNSLLRPGPPTIIHGFVPEDDAQTHILSLAAKGLNFLTLQRDVDPRTGALEYGAKHMNMDQLTLGAFGDILMLSNPKPQTMQIINANGLPVSIECLVFTSTIPNVQNRDEDTGGQAHRLKHDPGHNTWFVVPMDGNSFASNVTMVPCLQTTNYEDDKFYIPFSEALPDETVLDTEYGARPNPEAIKMCRQMSYVEVVELLLRYQEPPKPQHDLYNAFKPPAA